MFFAYFIESTRIFICFPIWNFILKIDNESISLYSSGKRFQTFGPSWEIVTVQYISDLTLCLSDWLFLRRTDWFKISVANICKFLWWILTDLYFLSGSSKDVYDLYTQFISLTIHYSHKSHNSQFIRLFNLLMWNIHTYGPHLNWKNIEAFVITLWWLRFEMRNSW